MAGNTIGTLFTVTTFGESHGPALGCVVDGCPPGLDLNVADIQTELDRRRPGKTRFETQRKEADEVSILSGVFEGKTTGTPIGLLIHNTDQRSKDYRAISDKFRPSHADYTYQQKYGRRDWRGGGRASARETAMRVAAGAIAKKYLAHKHQIIIRGYLAQLGSISITSVDWSQRENSLFFCPDADKEQQIADYMKGLKGNSIGARINIIADNVPSGLGEPVFAKLDADIAAAMMGINAVKGVEIGAGFNAITQLGSEHCDEMTPEGFTSNNAGGILGGISSGQAITVSIALKPTSSLSIPSNSINEDGEAIKLVTKGRHDPCVGIRATPIAEAMLAIVLMDHLLRHRGQNKDVDNATPIVPTNP